MTRFLGAVAVVMVFAAACGGEASDESTLTDAAASAERNGAGDSGNGSSSDGDGSSDEGPSNAVVDPAPPAQATASVDGIDYSFELQGGLSCSIDDDAITFSNRIGDNEVVVGGGANRVEGGWLGNFDLRIANPANEPGPISYFPKPGDDGLLDGSFVAVDGASMSYSGPMMKRPANDGSNPPPVDVGSGTISATC